MLLGLRANAKTPSAAASLSTRCAGREHIRAAGFGRGRWPMSSTTRRADRGPRIVKVNGQGRERSRRDSSNGKCVQASTDGVGATPILVYKAGRRSSEMETSLVASPAQLGLRNRCQLAEPTSVTSAPIAEIANERASVFARDGSFGAEHRDTFVCEGRGRPA